MDLYLDEEEDKSNPRSKLGARIRICGTVSELSFLAQTTPHYLSTSYLQLFKLLKVSLNFQTYQVFSPNS